MSGCNFEVWTVFYATLLQSAHLCECCGQHWIVVYTFLCNNCSMAECFPLRLICYMNEQEGQGV